MKYRGENAVKGDLCQAMGCNSRDDVKLIQVRINFAKWGKPVFYCAECRIKKKGRFRFMTPIVLRGQ